MNGRDVEALRHDSACLVRFIDTVVSACSFASDYPAYLPQSEQFFQCIRTLGSATKAFLGAFPTSVPQDLKLWPDYRRKLTTLRESWTSLHEYVKPAVDAHTLGIPYAFTDALLHRFKSIPAFRDCGFALIHTNEVMYYQLRASWIQEKIEELSRSIGIQSPFPPDIGIIALPFSQSNSTFLNCAIAHEMGHFAFQKLGLRNEFAPLVVNTLQGHGPTVATQAADDLSWIIGTVLKWVEELLCDLFAIWLIGPCFSFSYVELFDLTSSLGPPANANAFAFYDAHPADMLRVQQHLALLTRLGWWNWFSSLDSHYVSLLNGTAQLKETDFTIIGQREQDVKDLARSTFFKVIASVHARVNTLFAGIDSGAAEFGALSQVVEQYLWNGVVPSTVFHNLALRYPRVTTILNTATKVHISSAHELLRRIAGSDPTDPTNRAYWTSRLELWTMKALEDSVILERTGRTWG